MAKTCTLLTEGNFTSGGTSGNTASISPSAGAVVILAFAYDTATLSATGNGLTYNTVHNEVGVDGGRMFAIVGAGASPSAGPIALTFDTDAFVNYIVVQLAGSVEITGPTNTNHDVAAGASTAPAVTLSAFAHAANGVLAYIYAIDDVAVTEGAGFTLVDQNQAGAMFGHSDAVMWQDANDTSVNATISPSASWGILALEIVDTASGGGGGPTVLPESRKFGPRSFQRTLVNL